MTDFFGAFARGNREGAEIGGRMAARGLQRRTSELDEQLRSGAINMDQYEAGLREQQGRGMSRFHDTEETAGTLRERIVGELDRRDARHIAQGIVDARYADAGQLAGNRAVRSGDTAGALNSRKFMNNLDETSQITDVGGVPNYAGAYERRAKNAAAMGDLEGAQTATSGARDAMNQALAPLANKALNLWVRGDKEQAAGLLATLAEQRGLPMQFSFDSAGDLYATIGDGSVMKIEQDEMLRGLNDLAAGHDTLLEDMLKESSDTQAQSAAWDQKVRELALETSMDIIKETGMPESVAAPLTQARTALGAGGAKSVATGENGIIIMQIGNKIVHAIPVQEGEDQDAQNSSAGFQYVTPDGKPVNVNQIDDRIEQNLGAFAQASIQAQQVMDQSAIDQTMEFLNMRLGAVDQQAWTARGRPGQSPLAAQLSRPNTQIRDPEVRAAVQTFGDIVRNNQRLEGTGDNPASSAAGKYQFLDSTLRQHLLIAAPESQVAQDLSDMAVGSDEEKALLHAVKTTGSKETNALLDAAFDSLTAANTRSLIRAGIQPTPMALYAAHHFGAGGARKFLSASADTPITEVFPPVKDRRTGKMVENPVLAANPYLKRDGTVGGGLQSWQERAPELFADVDTTALAAAPEETPPEKAPAATPSPLEELVAFEREVRDEINKRVAAAGPRGNEVSARGGLAPPSDPEVAALTELYQQVQAKVAAARAEAETEATAQADQTRRARGAELLARGRGMLGTATTGAP
jgi:hypothetical protein